MSNWLQRVFRSCNRNSTSGLSRRKGRVTKFDPNHAAEILETRVLLDASREVGGLRFFTQGDFTDNGTISSTTSPVDIGMIPDVGGTFKPLLRLTEGIDLDTLASAEKFVTKGNLLAVTGTASHILANKSNTIDIGSLMETGAPILEGLNPVDVGKEKFLAKSLRLGAPEGSVNASDVLLHMAGDLNFPEISTGVSLDGLANVVTAGLAGKDTLVAAVNGDLPLLDNLTVGTLKFSKDSLAKVRYDFATDTLTIQGDSSFQFRNNTVGVAIGSEDTPGLTITNGVLTSFQFSVTGDIKIGAATIKTTNLTSTYDSANSSFKITGGAGVDLGNNTLQADFGANGTAGIVITNGSLTDLGFTTSSSVNVGGLSVKTNNVVATYADATDKFTLKGDASFALKNNTIKVGLGAGTTTGLEIVAGSVTEFSAKITADLVVGGLSFKTNKSDGLETNYIAENKTLGITGRATFIARGTTFNVLFGSNLDTAQIDSKGLLIQDGSLKSLDAAVTGTFDVSKVTFTAETLRLNYKSGVETSRYEISGGAKMEFTAGSVKSLTRVLFGLNGGPGLVIENGTFQTMQLEVNGNLKAAALTFDAKKLVINYNASTGEFRARGGINFTTKGTKIDLSLGGKADGETTDGLVIDKGQLETLDAAVTGEFKFSKVTFKGKSLRFTYKTNAPGTRFEVKGDASLEFEAGKSTSKANVTFGQGKEPGLVFRNGNFEQMHLTVTGNVTIGGLTFTAKELLMTYHSESGRFTANGDASFNSKGLDINIKLGSKASDGTVAANGLLIENGHLETLDAAVTGKFKHNRVEFTAKSLRFTWIKTTLGNRFDVVGGASLEFTANGKLSTVNVEFGYKSNPGLRFEDGNFTSMLLKVNGDVTISGLKFTAKDLVITGDAKKALFTANGLASFVTKGVNITVRFGETGSPGLIIENGSLTKLDATVFGSFRVAKATITSQGLRFLWLKDGSHFEMTGKASLAFDVGKNKSTATVIFGEGSKPGLKIVNGNFDSISMQVDGQFSMGSLTFVVEKLLLNYEAKTETFTARGTVNFTAKNTKLSLKLGSTSADGVVTNGLVIQDGRLKTLDAAITGGFKYGGATFIAKNLKFEYQDNKGETLFRVTGSARFEFTAAGGKSSVDVAFTTPSNGPGLIFENGDFKSFSLKVNGDLAISSLKFNAKDLFIRYDAENSRFSAQGEIGVDSKQVKLRIALGAAATAGLVIEDGRLKTLDAIITSRFEFSKVTFATEKLRFTYATKVENGKETGRFEVTGSALMSFQAGGSLSTIGVRFGTPTTAGLVFVDGKFKSIDLTTNADITIKGLTLTAKNLRVTYNADNGKFTASGAMSFRVAPGNKGNKVQIDIELGKNGTEGIVIENGELKKLDAAVTSSFEFSKFKFSTKNLRFQYSNLSGNTRFELTGTANLEFTVSGKQSNVSVEFGVDGNRGLVIENGSFRYLTVQVQGSLSLAGLTIRADNLTLKYDADQSEFIMYGRIRVSTGKKDDKKKVLDNVTVTMGSQNFDAPGIKIKDGRLERLDLTLDGAVRLGPLTVRTNQLRAEYSRNSGKLYITGTVKFELVKGRFVEFGFPAPERSTGVASRGLEIDTNTGEVKLNSLEVAVGGIQIKFVTIEDLRLRWISNGPNDFSIAGSMTLTVGIPKDGKSVPTVKWKGDIKFEFIPDPADKSKELLSAIEFRVTNSGTGLGALQTSSFTGRISGLNAEENFKLAANVTADIPIAGGIGGAKLLDVNGVLEVTRYTIRVKGRASVYSDRLFTGELDLSVDLATSRLKLNANGSGLGEILRGDLRLDMEMATGYFDASARIGLYTPRDIPIVGNKRVGSIGINVSYKPKWGIGYEAILPDELTLPEDQVFLTKNYQDRIVTSSQTKWGTRYSADGRIFLTLSDNGFALLRRSTGGDIWRNPTGGARIGEYDGVSKGWVREYDLSISYFGNIQLTQHYIKDPKASFQQVHERVIWETGDKGSWNPRLAIQNDGNLVLYTGEASTAEVKWETKTKTFTVANAAVNIAITKDAREKDRLANHYAGVLRHISAATLKQLAAKVKTREIKIYNKYISISGHLNALGADFWPHYEANLDTDGYKVWLDYDPPVFPKGTINLGSRGSTEVSAVYIVKSFSNGRSAVVPPTSPFLRIAAPVQSTAVPLVAAVAAPTNISSLSLESELMDDLPLPTVRIKSVSVNRSHNYADIQVESESTLTASINLFIDTDKTGRNGFLIDQGILSKKGLQTFRLSDIADRLPANVEKGETFYIYAVIDDGAHNPVYSKYSAAIVAPDFDPTITVPSAQKLMVDERLTFSSRNGNAITVKDPVLAIEKVDRNGNDSNELVAVLSTKGYGALHLKKIPATVTVTGNHTGNITLQGTASDITAALQDMVYDPILGANADQIAIGVRRANSDFVATYVSESIDIKVDTFEVHGIHNVNIDPDNGLTEIFNNVDIDSVFSDSIDGIFVQIDNYEKGQDLLNLNTEGIEDILADGIRARFDEELGRLIFGGGTMTEETCERLLENVEFMTTDSDAAKGVTVRMRNSVDDVEEFSQLLL